MRPGLRRRGRSLGGAAALVLLGLAAATAAGGSSAPARAARPFAPPLPLAAAVSVLPPRALAHRSRGYGWPLRPFDRPHPIRGAFGDPRFGRLEKRFHFGVDIPAAGNTPVYAVAPGTVYLAPDRVAVLSSARRETGFSYWHVLPAVREHAFVGRHALIGWVNPLWGHLHFAELDRGRWENPLRPGALTPSPAPLRPVIASIRVAPTMPAGRSTAGLSGRIALVVDAYALASQAAPAPWQGSHLAPSLLRWRLLDGTAPLTSWRTVVDFRDYIPSGSYFGGVYATGTTPNTPGRPGTYLYWLVRGWNVDRLAPGRYAVQVEAVGSPGAVATATAPLLVAPPVTR